MVSVRSKSTAIAAQNRSRQVLDSLATAVLITDRDGLVVLANEAAQSLLQVSERRVLGAGLLSLFERQHEIRTLWQSAVAQYRATVLRRYDLRLPMRQSTCQVNCSIAPCQWADSDADHWVVEITPIKPPEGALWTADKTDQQQAQHELLHSLAHEIRNPLGGMRGAAQLLQQELNSAELREYTQLIVREADRLANLIDRMQLSGSEMAYQRLNIHSVLDHVRQLLEAEFSQTPGLLTDAAIRTDYDPSLPPVRACRGSLIQAFMNVARNAIQASEGRLDILFKTRIDHQILPTDAARQQVVKISVIDRGTGIAREHLDRIFDPLFSRTHNGTGLGLAIVADIVRRHGGLIDVLSCPGETCFSIFLRLHQDDDAG